MKRNRIIILAVLGLLVVAGLSLMVATVSAGNGNQKVEFGNGNERVYPILTMPNPGECGSDSDDLILQYSTYWGPNVNPDNVKWNSDLWWVRSWIRNVYPSGLSANGLSTTTTRVCMGTRGQVLG